MTVSVGSTKVESNASGNTTTKSYKSGAVASGEQIAFIYEKDGSVNSNNDECSFSNMVIFVPDGTTVQRGTARNVKQLYIGVNGKARKIKKAYIGVNGKARLFWAKIELTYKGTHSTALSSTRARLAGATTGDLAMFAGGQNASTVYATVRAYDSNGTASTPSSLRTKRTRVVGTGNSTHAGFWGGQTITGNPSSSSYAPNTVELYTSTGTKSSVLTSLRYETNNGVYVAGSDSWGCANKNYLVFGGGLWWTYYTSYAVWGDNEANMIDNSNTISTVRASLLTRGGAGVSTTNYGFAYGGRSKNTDASVKAFFYAYDTSGSRIYLTAPVDVADSRGCALGDNAFYAGGLDSSVSGVANTFIVDGNTETVTSLTNLSVARAPSAVISVGENNEFALVCGGYNGSSYYNRVDVYTAEGTKTTEYSFTMPHTGSWGAGASVGSFGYVAGGFNGSTYYNSVKYFQLS